MPATIDRTTCHPDGAEHPAGPLRHIGLHGEHRTGEMRGRLLEEVPDRSIENLHAGELERQLEAAVRRRLGHGNVLGAIQPDARRPPRRALPILPPPTMSRVRAMDGRYPVGKVGTGGGRARRARRYDRRGRRRYMVGWARVIAVGKWSST